MNSPSNKPWKGRLVTIPVSKSNCVCEKCPICLPEPSPTHQERAKELLRSLGNDEGFHCEDGEHIEIVAQALRQSSDRAWECALAAIPEKQDKEPFSQMAISEKQKSNRGWNAARQALLEAQTNFNGGSDIDANLNRVFGENGEKLIEKLNPSPPEAGE